MRLSFIYPLILALFVSLAPAAAQPAPVRPGIDTLLEDPDALVGRRIGLVTHLAGVTYEGRPTAAALARIPGIRLAALFAPEHGLDGTYGAGSPVPTIPGRTPVYSLYGGSFRPTRSMLARVDVLVIDLQDVGVRPFTYASTMALVMAAARDAGKPVVVLDRPNPIAGVVVDGPVLEPEFRSFIGLYPIPMIHGLTLGELARLYNDAFGIGADLTVIPMSGWSRDMDWQDTGLAWINPSPGLTSAETTLTYGATGTVDGTNLWNGTRTSSRFQVVLAPWLDGPRLAERLNRRGLPGVRFSASAIPHPRTGRVWQGVRLHVTDPLTFRPAATTVHILTAIRDLHPGRLRIDGPQGRRRSLFDIVWGTKTVRLALLRGESAETIIAGWQPSLERFSRLRGGYLIYR
ncbi:MAG: exo-beta-N-acetylmuramidase NamZ family protein [Anaerolineales bacterium]